MTGDATLDIEFETLNGEARFENLVTVRDGTQDTFRKTMLSYDIELNGNGFSDSEGTVIGKLHGPSHEEMAGVLDDNSLGVQLIGGFGGVRTPVR